MNTTRSTRPNCAPAYYLGRPATMWRIALSRASSTTDGAQPQATRRRYSLPVTV